MWYLLMALVIVFIAFLLVSIWTLRSSPSPMKAMEDVLTNSEARFAALRNREVKQDEMLRTVTELLQEHLVLVREQNRLLQELMDRRQGNTQE